jgi:hypothetical protein
MSDYNEKLVELYERLRGSYGSLERKAFGRVLSELPQFGALEPRGDREGSSLPTKVTKSGVSFDAWPTLEGFVFHYDTSGVAPDNEDPSAVFDKLKDPNYNIWESGFRYGEPISGEAIDYSESNLLYRTASWSQYDGSIARWSLRIIAERNDVIMLGFDGHEGVVVHLRPAVEMVLIPNKKSNGIYSRENPRRAVGFYFKRSAATASPGNVQYNAYCTEDGFVDVDIYGLDTGSVNTLRLSLYTKKTKLYGPEFEKIDKLLV